MFYSMHGSWYIRPTPANYDGRPDLIKTWAGPVGREMYGNGLKDLSNRTQQNLSRFFLQVQKSDPCIQYGMKHWHPSSRQLSAHPILTERPKNTRSWESIDVMFSNNRKLEAQGLNLDEGKMKVCYLCSTMDEHKRHMIQHRPKKRPSSAHPRIEYIAPMPKVKHKEEKREEIAREHLYRVEVFTSDRINAGTSANVFVTIKGSIEMLPRTQLKKNRGSSSLCFIRASHEVFFIKGPFLGNLQILTIEHDGLKKNHAWHLDHIKITDIKGMKTWVFVLGEWLSDFRKPLFSNKVDLHAQEEETPLTEYTIEVHTGKQKMAGTDSDIYITLMGRHGSSKKIHLVDPSSDKKLFERNSVDKFRIGIHCVGELSKIRIEHDGKGFAAGWFLDKVIIHDSSHPKDVYYFMYGGWIAKDEGDGRLWREIYAKKQLPKELLSGTETLYKIMVKTGDKKFAGTDANVFIQMAGQNGITPKLKLDDAKNNFERNMVDNFEVRSVNVGPLKHIVIGHDNFGPGAGWFLDKVTVQRYIPKEEARKRVKKIKRRLKKEKREQKEIRPDTDLEGTEPNFDASSDREDHRIKEICRIEKKKARDDRKRMPKNLFSVSSSSESSDSSDTETEADIRSMLISDRPSSVILRSTSAKNSRKKEEVVEKCRRSSSYSQEEKVDRASRGPSRGERGFRHQNSVASQRRKNEPGKFTCTRASSLCRKAGKDSEGFDDDENLSEMKVPLYEEYVFECNRWLATDEDDGLCMRELPFSVIRTFFKEKAK